MPPHARHLGRSVTEFAHGTKGSRGAADRRRARSCESGNPYVQEHVDLIKAIRNDEKLNEGWYGATSSMTAVLGRMATYSGQVVKWDEAVAKGPQRDPRAARLGRQAASRARPGRPLPVPHPRRVQGVLRRRMKRASRRAGAMLTLA